MTLRHVGDKANLPCYVLKFDMAVYFDQVPIPYHERHRNVQLLRPKCKFAKLEAWDSPSTHMAHNRMGFGGSRNSNVGQRLANFIVFTVRHFLDILERPFLKAETGYVKQWLEQRQALNGTSFYRHDVLYAAHMYTDDIVGITVSGRVALHMIIAVYLTATNMNLLLAGMHKMEIGTGLRVLGGSLFVMLSVVAIPAYKRLHAAHQLRLLLSGSASFETYEKLVGLLVHCWILACMQEDMIDDMYKPLAHMRRSFQGGKNTLDPQSHQYLIPRWEQWLDIVTTRSAAAFSAALGSFNADVL